MGSWLDLGGEQPVLGAAGSQRAGLQLRGSSGGGRAGRDTEAVRPFPRRSRSRATRPSSRQCQQSCWSIAPRCPRRR